MGCVLMSRFGRINSRLVPGACLPARAVGYISSASVVVLLSHFNQPRGLRLWTSAMKNRHGSALGTPAACLALARATS